MSNGKQFLVTSQGRTGTKWLAHVMDKSLQWKVRHEPKVVRYGVPYMGYVSPKHLMRPIIPGWNFGIILRTPAKVAESVFHRCWAFDRPDLLKIYIENAAQYAKRMQLYIEKHNAVVLNFAMMVSSLKYINAVLEHFGIDDVELTSEDLSSGIKNRPYRKLPDGEYPPIWRKLKLDAFNQTHKHIGRVYMKYARQSMEIGRD